MKFYTVDRKDACKNIQHLELLQSDPYNKIVYSLDGYHAQSDSQNLISKNYPDGLSCHGWQYLLWRHDYMQINGSIYWDHATALELLFESVRLAKFADKPSRFQSYFAWQTLEEAIKFAPPTKSIYEVESDKYFIADQKLLTMSVQGVIALLYAEKYWRGEKTASHELEVLLIPPIKINKVVYVAP